jgi:hypothetical protein
MKTLIFVRMIDMGFWDWVYDKLWPPKTYGEMIERKLQRKITNRYFHITIKGKKSEYSLMNTISGGHIEWQDDIAHAEYKKKINWRPALDKDGNHEFHWGRPFGGEFGGELRKYYHWKVDAIPLMIHSPNYLHNAPLDLLTAIGEKFDEVLEEINSQKWREIEPGHFELKIKPVTDEYEEE